jgi:hypothetical protein
MIEDWIDEICKLAGNVSAGAAPGGKGRVRSFWTFKKSEFPEAITEFPAAITYVQGMRLIGGSDSGPTIALWRGVTEFHLAPSTGKQEIPGVMPYFGRILEAFLTKRTLGGLVSEFSLIKNDEGEAITAGGLTYGADGAQHMGLMVYWRVKEMVRVTVGN